MKYARKFNRNRQPRRGVTLMLVLALMSLFAMLVVTFMIVTTQARNAAESAAKALLEPAQDPTDFVFAAGGNAFDRASLQKLLVGDDMKSVIGPYSILENLYGNPVYKDNSNNAIDPLEGWTDGNVVISNGTLQVKLPFSDFFDSVNNGYYNADLVGHVLTIVEAPSAASPALEEYVGKSVLITAFKDIDTTNPYMEITDFSVSANQTQQRSDLNGNRFKFIINTPAFSGTGPGFDRSATLGSALLTGADDSGSSGVPFALRPNFLAPGGGISMKDHLTNDLVLMNPDYTAPDMRNLFLAWYDINNNGEIDNIIPSFHRPQLITAQNPSDWDELRKLVLRPLPVDHPNFSGSNPALDLSTYSTNVFNNIRTAFESGPLDVDNDNDGNADGVWLNIGLDPITVGNKQYLPLVSFLVRDLDGRLNVNTHGNLAQADSNFGKIAFFTDPDDQQTLTFLTTTCDNGSPDNSNGKFAGSGSGPADVRMTELLSETDLKKLLEPNGRYTQADGPDNFANDADFVAATIPQNLMGINPKAYGYNNASAGSLGGQMPDWFGCSPLLFDPLGNRAVFSFFDNNGSSNIYAYNPYLFDPYTASTRFSEKDAQLDLILRSPGDKDYNDLPARLRELLNDNLDSSNPSLPDPAKWSQFQHYLTTISSDIPVFSRFGGSDSSGSYTGFYDYILNRVYSGNDTDAQALYAMLPEEIRRGEKINLNKLTLDSDWVTDSDHEGMLKKKMQFANGIFLMLVLVGYDELYSSGTPDPQDLARLAQWSVNLVDFIDADAVLTPFLYSDDPIGNPLDYSDVSSGTDIDDFFTQAGWTLPTATQLVWGFEKPQLALTETLAVHNRRTANTTLGSSNATTPCSKCGLSLAYCSSCPGENGNTHEETFKQVLEPEASLFVELYHPGNPQRVNFPNDQFYASGKLDLAAVNDTDNTPVWRMVVGKRDASYVDLNKGSGGKWSTADSTGDLLAQLKADSALSLTEFAEDSTKFVPERYLWFVPTPTVPGDVPLSSVSYQPAAAVSALEPNEHVVIGPRNLTSFASKAVDKEAGTEEETDFGQPVFSSSDPEPIADDYDTDEDFQAAMTEYQNKKRSVVEADIILADASGSTGVNVSAPLTGYTGTTPASSPFSDDDYLFGIGTVPCYKTILLQRLADPRRPYNKDTNPYVTVDWSMIDLHVINSEERKISATEDAEQNVTKWDGEPHPSGSNTLVDYMPGLRFKSRQNGFTGITTGDAAAYPNLWSRLVGTDIDASFAGLGTAEYPASANQGPSKWHLHEDMSLGELNPFMTSAGEVTQVSGGDYNDVPKPGFLHFPWNDAPLTNTFELMLVPACSYDRFCFEFYDTGTDTAWDTADSLGNSGMRFANPTSGIGPYLNFFHSDTSGSLNLARLFEYVRVPSRFAGTIRGWTADGKPIYSMREPGKINLNTMTETAWDALTAGDSRYKNYSDLRAIREDTTSNSEAFCAPFRSPQSFNLVGDTNLVPGTFGETTLLRSGSGAATPFIEPNKESGDGTNPYMELENVMRLSDVTTNRSNVFAIWMTVGFFETTKYNDAASARAAYSGQTSNLSHITNDTIFNAVYPDGYVLGKEKGLDDGTVQRLRSFYIIDRSIPVGFRRGQKLNSENVILNPTKTTLD